MCVGYLKGKELLVCLRAARLSYHPTVSIAPVASGTVYQKFSQEMLSNGELNHLPMKERMGEIGGPLAAAPSEREGPLQKAGRRETEAVQSGCSRSGLT